VPGVAIAASWARLSCVAPWPLFVISMARPLRLVPPL
jgi:hypothetical protein